MKQLHHVVYQQRVRAEGGDAYDPRNLMEVEAEAHEKHHNRSRPLALVVLPDTAFEFAAELLGGVGAYSYLRRRYIGVDPRLERLLLV